MNSLHKNISCRRWERAKLEMAFSSRNFFQISDPHVQKISWIPRVKHISCRGGEAVQLRTKSLTYGSLFIQVFMWGGNYLPYSKVYTCITQREFRSGTPCGAWSRMRASMALGRLHFEFNFQFRRWIWARFAVAASAGTSPLPMARAFSARR